MILGSFALECLWGAALVSSGFGVGSFMVGFLWLSAAAAELVRHLAIFLTYVGAVHSFLLQMISHVFNLFLITDC